MNGYLLEGDAEWSLVDSGMHNDKAKRELNRALGAAGIALPLWGARSSTDLHPHRLGMAGSIAATDADVVMHGPELVGAREVWPADRGSWTRPAHEGRFALAETLAQPRYLELRHLVRKDRRPPGALADRVARASQTR